MEITKWHVGAVALLIFFFLAIFVLGSLKGSSGYDIRKEEAKPQVVHPDLHDNSTATTDVQDSSSSIVSFMPILTLGIVGLVMVRAMLSMFR